MRKYKRLLLFISLFIFIVTTAQKNNKGVSNVLPDWRKDTFDYAKQIIPKEVKNPASQELIPITIKKAYITNLDHNPIVLAICAVDSESKGTSSLTYFFISPKTNQLASKFRSVLTIEGCDYSIPAFVIKDIDGDQKDDLIFLEL
ncbi:hypothetical protein MKJ01_18350 [Chryseobacterium sp. SSA4.19]|uniref:hypothetical protein n=1 Tax=Chryseobacterium sp. SSA4.19 TaxID=2919915 RepID=UPI001F4D9CDE|nr:hypothetical protein [Chryseobacterium sp. SSA4.19]MCJ8155720.1 hypothetical protein [Chryseobacterium sp. SSA4.19]